MDCWKTNAHLSPRAKIALHSLMIMGYMQALLGITTLIHFVPVWLASLYRNGSLALISIAMWLANEILRVPK